MSKYTTEVRFICETMAGLTESEGYTSINTILDECASKIFDFDFPIFDETYRPVLERKILKHYYTREIATETVGLWKHFLDMRMNEIMPYYNKLYETELLEFNPFYNVDLTTDRYQVGNRHTNESGKTENLSYDTSDITSSEEMSTRLGGTNEVTSRETNDADKSVNTETSTAETMNANTAEKHTGSESKKDTGTISDNNISTNTRTDNLTQTESESGTITDTGTASNTRTDNLTKTERNSGSDTVSGSKIDKNSRWDIYSDTPQGSLQNITTNDGAYLTNARHIIDDGTGSTNSSTTNYGKQVTTTNTGTQADSGNSSNERELDTSKETVNSGSVKSDNTEANTRTLDTAQTTTDNKDITGSNNTVKDSLVGVNSTETNNVVNERTERNTNTGTNDSNTTGNKNILNTGANDTKMNRERAINTTEDYLQHVRGKTPGISFSKLLTEYRDTFINIDMLIIRELADLFFGLW